MGEFGVGVFQPLLLFPLPLSPPPPPFGQHSIEHMLLQPRSAPETTLDFVHFSDVWREPECRRVVPCPSTRRAQLLLRTQIGGVRSEGQGLGRHPFSEPFTSTGGLLHIP